MVYVARLNGAMNRQVKVDIEPFDIEQIPGAIASGMNKVDMMGSRGGSNHAGLGGPSLPAAAHGSGDTGIGR